MAEPRKGSAGAGRGPTTKVKAAPQAPKPKVRIVPPPRPTSTPVPEPHRDIITPRDRAALRRIEADKKRRQKEAFAATAPATIFYPNALTRPKKPPTTPSLPRGSVFARPAPAPSAYQLAVERQKLSLGLTKGIDPTRQPKQDLRAVPTWVRAGRPDLKPKKKTTIGSILGVAKDWPGVITEGAGIALEEAETGGLATAIEHGTWGDLGKSVYESFVPESYAGASEAFFGRSNELIRSQIVDKGYVTPSEFLGAAALDTAMLLAGPETQQAIIKLAGGPGDPNLRPGFNFSNVPVEVMMATPFLRVPKFAAVWLKAIVQTGGDVTKATSIARQAYLESRPVVTAYRNLRQAGTSTRIRAADSRLGRAVEDLGDRARDSRFVPLKSSAALEGEATLRQARMVEGETTAGAQWIQARINKLGAAVTKLSDEKLAALRLVAEQTTPEEKMAFHIGEAHKAADAGDEIGAMFHSYQADAAQKAARWVTVKDDVVKLSKGAPSRVQRALAIIQKGGEERQALIRELGLMTDEEMARRLTAPKRVIGGARWTRQEEIIQQKLEALPERQQAIEELAKAYPDDELRIQVALMDARARAYAQTTGDPENVGAFFANWDRVEFVDQQFVPPSHLGIASSPGESDWIPGDEQLDLFTASNDLLMQADQINDADLQRYYSNMARRLVRAHKDALPENAQTVRKMQKLLLELRQRAIEAEQYKLWYENSAAAILREAGGDIDLAVKIAKLVAIYSPRAKVFDPKTAWNNTGRALGALDEWRNGQPISDRWSLSKNRFGKNGEPLPDWQTIAAQNAMDDAGDWEGIKTNSFYSNFLREIDPERHAAEFGEEAKRVTIDTWMRRAFRYLRGNAEQKAAISEGQLFEADVTGKGTETISDPMYYFMQDATTQIGDELGWDPHQAQAAIWTSIKAEVEGIPLNEAGLDFAEAIRLERERGDLTAGVQTLFDPEAPPTGEFDVEALKGPMTLQRFLREEYIRATGKQKPTAQQIARFEDEFDKLPEDDPRRLEYERLADEYYTPDKFGRTEDIPFQLEEGDNVGKFVMPSDQEIARLGLQQLEELHRQAMRSGTQDEIMRVRKTLREVRQKDPLEQAFDAPSAREPSPEAEIDTEPAGVYTDPRVAPRAARAPGPLAEEFSLYGSFARDIARTLPEEEWPTWVKNMLRAQNQLGVKVERVGDEALLTPGETSFFDAIATEGRVVPSTEVEGLEREGDFIYHGTDPDSAAQIMEHRVFKVSMAGRTGQGRVWFTDNPRLAARYADAKTFDRGKGDRGVVIVLPKSVLPEGAFDVGEPVYGKGNRYFGGSTYTTPNDVFFQSDVTPPLDGLPTTAKVAGETWQVGPSQELRDISNGYMADKPWAYRPPTRYVSEEEIDVAEREGFARMYDEALDWNDPRATPEYRAAVERSYRAFGDETLEQYLLLEQHGYTFEFYPEGVDPYPRSPREAIRDLTENKHMYVYPTEAGYGQGQQAIEHPLLELVPDLEWGGRPVTWNDLFRAVHDVFGHGKEGFGFRAAGEDMAWRTHAAMYSPEARPAMTMETRGQNSWVNFGPHGEANRKALTAETVFAEQKAALPPATMMDLGDNSHVEDVLQRAIAEPDSVHLLDGSLLEAQATGPGAAYGHAEERIPLGQATLFDIEEYRAANAIELGYPQHRLGIWHDPDAQELVLDVGRAFDNAQEAIDFGRKEGQIAVWDGEKSVSTGITDQQRDEIQDALRAERTGLRTQEGTEPLAQRTDYSRRGRGTGAIVGATDWRSGRAIIYLSRSSDASTFQHELAHYSRRFLTKHEERMVASWCGAKKVYRTDPETGKKKLVGYEWTREAEEMWAEAVTSTLRQGRGPKSVSHAVNAISKDLRHSYRVQDMPDMPPHVAEVILKQFDFIRPGPKRGRLWGGEVDHDDLLVNVEHFIYMPYGKSAPIAASRAAGAVGGYIRAARDIALQRPRPGAAMGARKVDPNMTKSFTGRSIVGGDYDPGISQWVKVKMIEGKIRALEFARARFLEAATPLPTSAKDIPIKVDPSKNASPELKTMYERLGLLDIEGALTPDDLEGIGLPVYEELLEDLSPREVRSRVLELMREEVEPIDNIVWVNPKLVNPFLNHATGGLEKYGWGVKALKMTADMINDYQKALVLFLHPAYVPMQLIGNMGMAFLDQGFAAPKNMWNAVRLHRELTHSDILKIDSYAGIGAASVVMDMKSFGKPFSATLGEYANMAADMIPRRAAWLHHARKAGYDTAEDISALLNSRTDDAMRVKFDIAQKARDGMVDFDRLHPFEREILTRMIWFYPWLRGATRWSARFALEHPATAIGLAVLAQYSQAYIEETYGDLPSYLDTAVPLDTGIVPWLDKLVGEHRLTDEDQNPYFMNMRQVFTFTTPYDLSRTAWGFVTGNPSTTPLTENLVPVVNAAIVSAVGYDPYEDKEVSRGPGTFFRKLNPAEAPAYEKMKRIISPPEESDFKVFRRDRGDEIANLFVGSIAPAPVNIPAAQRSAAKDKGDTFTEQKIDFERMVKKAGVPIPPGVYDMLRDRAAIESRIKDGDTSVEKATVAAEVYAKRTGNTFPLEQIRSGAVSEEQAQAIYEEIRAGLFGRLPAIERELKQLAGEE